MSDEHHTWKLGSDPPTIRPHSLAKHRVLKSYLERYVSVLTSNPAQDRLRLTLVDGFAGGGLYLDGRTNEQRSGSPLLMLEAMRAAESIAREARTKPFCLDVDYFFVEKNPDSFEYLKTVLEQSEFRNLLQDKIHLICGSFVSEVEPIVSFIEGRGGAGRAIFVLDQFGYTDVPIPIIKNILQRLGKAEVILTFATDSLIDYLSTNELTQKVLQNLGISLPPQTIETAKSNPDWRRTIQFALHDQIPRLTGAEFYTPFFIRSTEAHRDFWLIHLSGHHRARDVMVGLHWKENTSFAHYGRSGLRMLGYDQKTDPEWTKQKLLDEFGFDEMALASSQEELMEQLPERLSMFSEGLEFNKLFARTTNESPATAAIMKGVLTELAREGIIQVRDKSGAVKRGGAVTHGSDIILPHPQKKIFFSP